MSGLLFHFLPLQIKKCKLPVSISFFLLKPKHLQQKRCLNFWKAKLLAVIQNVTEKGKMLKYVFFRVQGKRYGRESNSSLLCSFICVSMSHLISEMYVFLYLIVSWIRAKMQKQNILALQPNSISEIIAIN